MGKFKTSKNILRNKGIKRISRKKTNQKRRIIKGGGNKTDNTDKEKFKNLLEIFDREFKHAMCQAYSFSPDNIGFLKKDRKYMDHTNLTSFGDIDEIVNETHSKLSEWNKCLNLSESETPQGNVKTSGTPTKPEKLFILSVSHGSYIPETEPSVVIPDNIVVCFFTKEGQAATYWDENDFKSWLSIADYNDEQFEEIYKKKIKNTTHSFDNSYDNVKQNCFNESSWFYPGQKCYNMGLYYGDEQIKTTGLYMIRPKEEQTPMSNRKDVVDYNYFREKKRLLYLKNVSKLNLDSEINLNVLLKKISEKFSDKKIIMTFSCCRILNKTDEDLKILYHNFYYQVINAYLIDNLHLGQQKSNTNRKGNTKSLDVFKKKQEDIFDILLPEKTLEDLQKELTSLEEEYDKLKAPSYPKNLEFSSNPEIEEIKKIYKEIINLDKLIEILDILEFINSDDILPEIVLNFRLARAEISNLLEEEKMVGYDYPENLKTYDDLNKLSTSLGKITEEKKSLSDLITYQKDVNKLKEKIDEINKILSSIEILSSISDTFETPIYSDFVKKYQKNPLDLIILEDFRKRKNGMFNKKDVLKLKSKLRDELAKKVKLLLLQNTNGVILINTYVMGLERNNIIAEQGDDGAEIIKIKLGDSDKFKVQKVYDEDYKEIDSGLLFYLQNMLAYTELFFDLEGKTLNSIKDKDKDILEILNDYFDGCVKAQAKKIQRDTIYAKMESLNSQLDKTDIKAELTTQYEKVIALNEEFKTIKEKLGKKYRSVDAFSDDIGLLDPKRYFYSNNFKHYKNLLEIIEEVIKKKIKSFTNPDEPIEDYKQQLEYFNRSADTIHFDTYKYRHGKLLCFDRPHAYTEILKNDVKSSKFKQYNPLASVFCIKIFNFISSCITGKLDMTTLINNLKTSSIGQISFLLYYLIEKSTKFNQEHFKDGTDNDNDTLFSHIFEELKKDKTPSEIFEELDGTSEPKSIAKKAFDKKPFAEKEFDKLCYDISQNYIYRYIYHKLIASAQEIITKSNIQNYYFNIFNHIDYIDDLNTIQKSKVIQLLKIFNLLKVDTDTYVKTYFPDVWGKKLSSSQGKIVFNIEDVKEIKFTQSFNFIEKSYKSIDFRFNYEEENKEIINNAIENINKIIINYRKNWEKYFEDNEEIKNITSLELNIQYFIPFDNLIKVFPNLQELECKFMDDTEEGIDINIPDILNFSFDCFGINKINKINFKNPDSKVKLESLGGAKLDINCDELTLENIRNDFVFEQPELKVNKLNLHKNYFDSSKNLNTFINKFNNLTSLHFTECFNIDLDLNTLDLTNLESLKLINCSFKDEEVKLDLYDFCIKNTELTKIFLYDSGVTIKLKDIFKIAEVPKAVADAAQEDPTQAAEAESKVERQFIYYSKDEEEDKDPLGRELEITIHQKYVPDDEPFRDDGPKSDSLKFVEECSSQFINDKTGDTTFEGFEFNNLKINFVNNELYYQFHEFFDDINTYEIGIESSYYSSLDDI